MLLIAVKLSVIFPNAMKTDGVDVDVACVDVLVAGVVEGAGDEGAEVHQRLRVVTPVPHTTSLIV